MKSFQFFSTTILKFFLLLGGFFILFIGIFILGTGYNILYFEKSQSNPEHVFSLLRENGEVNLTENKKKLLDKNQIWYLRLDQAGRYMNSYRAPKIIQRDYKAQDLARLSRWYLEDYPVFTFIDKEQIHILGYPPDSYSKFPANYFHIDLFFRTLYLFVFSLVFIIVSLFLVYFQSKKKLWQEIGPLSQAIYDLSENKSIHIEEGGNLADIKGALNQSARNMEKNQKDREIWLRGISHDLRTPLTILSAYSQKIENKYGPSQEIKKIQENALRAEKILEGLNVTYMLETLGPENQSKKLNLKGLLREISVDILNRFGERVQIQSHFPEEEVFIQGQRDLLDRAIRNLVYNSLDHNDQVLIDIRLEEGPAAQVLTITDNGRISPEKVLEINQKEYNRGQHGYGILIVKKIIEIHGGKIDFSYKNPGLESTITFPNTFPKSLEK